MATNRAAQLVDPVTMLDKIETAIRSLSTKRDELQREIDHLKVLGWVEAKPYYRNEKYMYLIYPMVNGERRREYIGADPDKIQEAMDRIERKSKIEELQNKLDRVESAIHQTKYHLSQAISAAYSVQW